MRSTLSALSTRGYMVVVPDSKYAHKEQSATVRSQKPEKRGSPPRGSYESNDLAKKGYMGFHGSLGDGS